MELPRPLGSFSKQKAVFASKALDMEKFPLQGGVPIVTYHPSRALRRRKVVSAKNPVPRVTTKVPNSEE